MAISAFADCDGATDYDIVDIVGRGGGFVTSQLRSV